MDIGAISSYLKDNQALPLGNTSGFSREMQSAIPGVSGEGDTFSRLLDRLNQPPGPASAEAGSSDSAASVTAGGSGQAALSAERYGGSPGRSLGGKLTIDKTDKLFEQCQELETFLVKTLISGMRKTIQKSEFIDTGFAGEMYEDMLYDEYAKDYAKNAGFGLAELAYAELTGQRGKLIANHA
ncbi:hypothetical protein FACS189493_2570 [Spirochaetia bacterium]|nr:hypothetical protein FACS189493_2570 [Spirochaetia bacterium]